MTSKGKYPFRDDHLYGSDDEEYQNTVIESGIHPPSIEDFEENKEMRKNTIDELLLPSNSNTMNYGVPMSVQCVHKRKFPIQEQPRKRRHLEQ